jgi:hypothetical protein
MAIDMLAECKVATFIDSSYRALRDQSNYSSADLEELESALNHEFRPHVFWLMAFKSCYLDRDAKAQQTKQKLLDGRCWYHRG